MRIAIVAVVLGTLELAPRVGLINQLTLIPLSAMVQEVARALASGELWSHLWVTGSSIWWSVVLAVVTGLPAGYLLSRVPRLHRMMRPYMTSYYAVPVFVFYPMFIAVFGQSRAPILLMGWSWATVAVALGTVTGFAQVDPVYRKVASLYGLSTFQAVWRVYIRAAAPSIFGGIKLSLSYAIVLVIGAEFILASEGLGHLVHHHYNSFAVAPMYGAILSVILFAVVLTSVVFFLERRAHR